MSRRLLLDDEIAKELELLVSLPDDPANSEDEYESDEHGEEYNVEKLKNLLVNSEGEQSSSSSNTNINIPETIPSPVTQEFPQSYKDNIESHIQNTSIEHFQISIPENPQIEMSVGQPSCSRFGISSNETIEESSEESESEGSWNKAMWSNGNRPHYSVFDKITLTPRSPISYNSRPLVYFDKFFTNEVYNLIIEQTNLYAQKPATTQTGLSVAEISSEVREVENIEIQDLTDEEQLNRELEKAMTGTKGDSAVLDDSLKVTIKFEMALFANGGSKDRYLTAAFDNLKTISTTSVELECIFSSSGFICNRLRSSLKLLLMMTE
ncbi:unnamed protein product [Parnassius apollo]|uniref:(apollo) hypothetical protein n=1 Tax=Parnassius apollo TaxID=110799 RepID=A0A8S3WT06_PARAO|nr:unnamed protein product [Parnassius apollo]